jgi:hypothetical protein
MKILDGPPEFYLALWFVICKDLLRMCHVAMEVEDMGELVDVCFIKLILNGTKKGMVGGWR